MEVESSQCGGSELEFAQQDIPVATNVCANILETSKFYSPCTVVVYPHRQAIQVGKVRDEWGKSIVRMAL